MSFEGKGVWLHPENVGEVGCPFCDATVPVRKNKRGRLYFYCPPAGALPGCGMVTPNLPGGQAWLLDHAHMFGPGEVPKALKDMAGEITRKSENPAPKATEQPPARVSESPKKPAEKSVNEKPAEKPAAKPEKKRLFGGLMP